MPRAFLSFKSQKGEISATLALIGLGIMLLGIVTGTRGARQKQTVTPRAVGTQVACSEDDGGEEYGNAGTTIYEGNENKDECKSGDAVLGRGDSVIEYRCDSDGVVRSAEKYCWEIACKPKCAGENEKGYCDCSVSNIPSVVTPVPTNYPTPTAAPSSSITSVSVLSHTANSATFQVNFCSGESPGEGATAEYWIDGNYAVSSSPLSIFHQQKDCKSIPLTISFTDTYRTKYCPSTKMTAVVRYNSVYYRLHFSLPYTNDGVCVCIPNGETPDCSRCCPGVRCETSPLGPSFCMGSTPTPTGTVDVTPSPTIISTITPTIPTSTPTLIPTSIPSPTRTPTPTKTPTPTAIPTVKPTSTPVPTDKPTTVPLPSSTPTPMPITTFTPTPTPGPCIWQNDTSWNFSGKVICSQVPVVGTNCSLENVNQGNNVCTQSCTLGQANIPAAPCMCFCKPTPTPTIPVSSSVTPVAKLTSIPTPTATPVTATSITPSITPILTSVTGVPPSPNPSIVLACPPVNPAFGTVSDPDYCSLDQPSGSLTFTFNAKPDETFIYQIIETPIGNEDTQNIRPVQTKSLTGKSIFTFPVRSLTEKEKFTYSLKNKYPPNYSCQDWSVESPVKELTLSCYPTFTIVVNPDRFNKLYSQITNSNCTDLKIGVRIGHKVSYTNMDEGVLDYEAYQSYTGAESYKFDINDAKLDLDTEYILWAMIINGEQPDSDNDNVLASEARGYKTIAHQSVYVLDPAERDSGKISSLCGVIPSVTPGIIPQQ